MTTSSNDKNLLRRKKKPNATDSLNKSRGNTDDYLLRVNGKKWKLDAYQKQFASCKHRDNLKWNHKSAGFTNQIHIHTHIYKT